MGLGILTTVYEAQLRHKNIRTGIEGVPLKILYFSPPVEQVYS